MREIKFRVWDLVSEEMVSWEWLVGYCDISYLVEYQEPAAGYHNAPMQFTGLKDCNGVDVYEGDVVAVQLDSDEPTIHKVEWGGKDYPAFELSPDLGCECNGFAQYYNDPDTTMKVIGNIYESPELLEAK